MVMGDKNMTTCPHCGKVVKKGNFCSKCGKKLAKICDCWLLSHVVKTNTVMFYGYVAVIAARSILFLAVSCFEENQNLVDVMPMTCMLHSFR